ncbi:MAG: peptide chain release factor N(5)-glutamine methyltransferase [Candidatus Wallbacteria bacterium]|nr:peptide chain release factor N(5)-glutamine methyltransferase [Candidatus Wallbacteria bacterium]
MINSPNALEPAKPSDFPCIRYLDVLRDLAGFFHNGEIPDPEREAALLLSYLMDKPVSALTALNPEIPGFISDNASDISRKRVDTRQPLAYLLGKWHFYGNSFLVEPGLLVPRCETELLVELILNENENNSFSCLDIGCGSGNIAVTLAMERMFWTLTAIDVDERAVSCTQQNAINHSLANITVRRQDIRTFQPGFTFDMIVSNPPYIRTSELSGLQPEVRHESQVALDGGTDGLMVYRAIADFTAIGLRRGGLVYLEIDPPLVTGLSDLFSQIGTIEVFQDLSGLDRFMRVTAK